MANPNRLTNASLRQPSLGGLQASSSQSPMLLARINEKKTELENLKQLRDLSAGLATQMQTLEEKLATLSDGTEAVAAVLSNWHTVLQAINMASSKIPKPKVIEDPDTASVPSENALPQTLVRIPAQEEAALSPPQDITCKVP
ncbi:MAG: hypothetical protein LQ346_000019 [Caloplaca aetnensis]|nr:MAG: hypothetical protein LQ346_000019 [Caloplaca aetnensis]